MSEPILSARMALERSLSSPMMCSWPTTSSSVLGRMRLASGAPFSRIPLRVNSNRSMRGHRIALFYLVLFSHIRLSSTSQEELDSMSGLT